MGSLLASYYGGRYSSSTIRGGCMLCILVEVCCGHALHMSVLGYCLLCLSSSQLYHDGWQVRPHAAHCSEAICACVILSLCLTRFSCSLGLLGVGNRQRVQAWQMQPLGTCCVLFI